MWYQNLMKDKKVSYIWWFGERIEFRKIKVIKSYLIPFCEFLFVIFLCTLSIVNSYFLRALRIYKNLLSYTFNEIINLVHWPKLGTKYFII